MDMMFNTEVIVKDMEGGKEDMTEKRFIHSHIIRIDYPVGTDVRDTEPMIKHIKSVITRELGKEPIIEEYLL